MVLTAGYLGVLTVLAGGLGVWALLSGESGPAVFLLGAEVYLGLVTALSVWLLRSRRPGSSSAVSVQGAGSGENGIRVAYSGWLYRWFVAMTLLTSAVLVTLVLTGLAGWVIPPFTSPPGIHHRSLTFEHFVPWSDVQGVSAVDVGGPLIAARVLSSGQARVRRTSWMGKQQEFQLLPDMAIRGRSLAVDPAVLYHALRYYHAHPDARAELVTEVGLQRIRNRELLD